MRSVSSKWKENQEKNFVERSDIKITLDVTDPEATADVSASANSAVDFSRVSQIVNDKDKTVKNYATLEQNFWSLDGTNRILPRRISGKPNVGDVGYVSDIMSESNCTFTTNPVISLAFSRVFTTTIPAITILWNRLSGEFATNFKITAYNGETVVAEKTVTNNLSVESIVYQDFTNYDKIAIEVVKWCKPFSRVRITDIDLGISKEFLKENIISMSITEEVDTIGASFPTNRLKFELDNHDDFFNPYNEAGFYRYLTKRQRIISKVGYYNSETDSIEWVKMGEYFLSNWDSPQNSITANFEANNLLSFLNNKKYIESDVSASGITLYNLAYNLLSNAGLRKNYDETNKWVLSDVLKQFTTKGILPVCTQLEALQYIAQAACCVLFCDNDGNIHIEPINNEETDYEISMFNSYQYPEVEVQKTLGKVQVNLYSNNSATQRTELFNGVLDIEGDEVILIEFSSPTIDTSSLVYTITGAASHSEVSYNNGCKLSIVGGSGEVTVVITGKAVETSSRIVTIINDTNSDEEQDVDNPLITSYTQAKAVGEWVKEWLIKRNQISTEWRCDPRLNAMDKVKIENKYGTKSNARVTSVEMTYKGGFKGKMSGRLL